MWWKWLLAAYSLLSLLMIILVCCLLKSGKMKEDPRFEGDKLGYRS